MFVISTTVLFSIGSAYGHGFGLDTTPPISIHDREAAITVELPMDFEQGSKRLVITATDDSTDEAMPDITYMITIHHGGQVIFQDLFFAAGGLLSIDTEYSEGQFQVHGMQNASGAWYGNESAPLEITGPIFESGGLYTFEMAVATKPAEITDAPRVYADLTLIDTTEFIESDSKGQDVKFRLKSYFDEASSFEYDPEKKQVTFEMPFDWSEKRMSHVSVVHEEVHFPKDFAEFLYPSYVGKVNGIELFKASVVVDDYTEDDERIVHFVLLQDHLRFLKNQQKDADQPLPDSMTFTLSTSEEIRFPLTAFTRSEDFQVDLSWDPVEIEPDQKTNFIFTIRDGATGEPMRNSEYTFVILQNGQEIHRASGQAQVGGYFESYEFAQEQTGPTIIRFENIRNTGQETEFGLVVVPEFGGIVMVALASGMAGALALGARFGFRPSF